MINYKWKAMFQTKKRHMVGRVRLDRLRGLGEVFISSQSTFTTNSSAYRNIISRKKCFYFYFLPLKILLNSRKIVE